MAIEPTAPDSTAAPPTPTGASTTQVVASGSPQNPTATTAAHSPAQARIEQFGGNPGGRPRADGLRPGSPEAKEADRKKEATRKAAYRAVLRAANPPALPSKIPVAAAAPAGNSSAPPPVNEAGGVVSAPPALVLWQPDDFREVIGELIPLVEQQRVKKRTTKAAAAKLAPKLLKEIEADAHFPDTAKKTLSLVLPRLGAKYANMSGISAEWKDEAFAGLALVQILRHDIEVDAKLDKIIAQNDAMLKQQAEPTKKT